MIINYFNVVDFSLFPHKTYSPLIVNSDANLFYKSKNNHNQKDCCG